MFPVFESIPAQAASKSVAFERSVSVTHRQWSLRHGFGCHLLNNKGTEHSACVVQSLLVSVSKFPVLFFYNDFRATCSVFRLRELILLKDWTDRSEPFSEVTLHVTTLRRLLLRGSVRNGVCLPGTEDNEKEPSFCVTLRQSLKIDRVIQ